MTPKEYADELVEKYRSSILSFLSDKMKDENAKQCAIIAVDRIKEELIVTDFANRFEYFEQVKTEIENYERN